MNQSPNLLNSLRQNCILPVFKSSDLPLWQALIDISHNCGINVMEVRDVRDLRGFRLFQFLMEYASRYDGFQLGISTIKPAAECEMFLAAGASFVCSPFLSPSLAEICHQFGKTWIPGCSGHADISRARDLGTNIISILPGAFPGELLKNVLAQYPGLHFIPSSGNETSQSMNAAYLRAGALCIRRESEIFPGTLTAVRDWRAIERLILKNVHFVKKTKTEIYSVTQTIL